MFQKFFTICAINRFRESCHSSFFSQSSLSSLSSNEETEEKRINNNNNDNDIENDQHIYDNTFWNLSPLSILRFCTALRGFVVLLFVVFFHICGGHQHYLKFGPQPDFKIFNIAFDTHLKYWSLVSLIVIVILFEMVVKQIGIPIIKFYVYNPQQKIVKGITKRELQIYTNTLQCLGEFMEVITVVMVIEKLDVLLISVFIRSIIPIFTVHYILKNKRFKN